MTGSKEALSGKLAPLDDERVSEYLFDNPDFFVRNASQVENMVVPHPVRGSISLVEWQMTRQRNQIRQLEQEVVYLMEQASTNQRLFTQLIELQTELSLAVDLSDFRARLQAWARRLGLAGAYIRLFNEFWHLQPPLHSLELGLSYQSFEPVRIQRFRDKNHYLGALHGPEILLLIPHISAVGSVAMSLLGQHQDIGVVIFTSRDKNHYHSTMGTALLDHIAQILPPLLSRWIARK